MTTITETLQSAMNRLAGTTGLDAQGAANVWANTLAPSSASATGWVGSEVSIADNGDHIRATLTSATVGSLAQNVRAINVPAVAGRTYTAITQGRTNTSAPMLTALEFRTESTFISSAQQTPTAVNSSTFTYLPTLTVVAPANTTRIIFYIGLGATGARAIGEWFDVRRAWLGDGTAGNGGLDLVGALNFKNESTGVGLAGVLNQLAETQGLGVDGAASRIVA